MLRLEDISKQLGGKTLLDQARLTVNPGERVGLVGPNGTGKTTLFRLLQGELECDAGTLSLPTVWRVGALRQELSASDQPILAAVQAGDRELNALVEKRRRLLAQLEGKNDPHLIETLGETDHRLEEIGAFDARARAGKILMGLGFTLAELERPLSAFSGGWRMRVALAQLLFSRPDLLLLDEPTNHLDLESAAWLEGWLLRASGTVIVISHDRGFLNRVAQVIVTLEEGKLTRYVGNFEKYLLQREEQETRLIKQAERQSQRVAELTRFIERFRAKATKARQAQSRIKQLARLEPVETIARGGSAPRFKLPQPTPCAREAVVMADVGKGYDEKRIFDGLQWTLLRGEKIALLGPNGAGKSTFLRLLAGEIAPDRGRVTLGDRARVSYFAQHALEALDPAHTVLESAMEVADNRFNEQAVRTILGGFLFSGDEVRKQVTLLSGGEKARLALCRLFLSGANVLLLDEPTNHLDMNARAALEEALEAYEGTLLLVSHDRDLLETVCDGYQLVDGGGVRPWEGSLDDYLMTVSGRRDKGEEDAARPAPRLEAKENRRLAAEIRQSLFSQTNALKKKAGRLEARIQTLEEEGEGLEARLTDETLYRDENKGELLRLMGRRQENEAELAACMAEWESVSLEIEGHETRARESLTALNA